MNTDLSSDGDYSPTVPGEYTWPLGGTTGYYGTFIAGPLPPLDCSSSVPAGTDLVGCFVDSSTDRLLNSDALVRSKRGPGGMTAQVGTLSEMSGVDSLVLLSEGCIWGVISIDPNQARGC